MAERLLIIDDDARLAAMVSDYLTAAGFAVERRARAAKVWRRSNARRSTPSSLT